MGKSWPPPPSGRRASLFLCTVSPCTQWQIPTLPTHRDTMAPRDSLGLDSPVPTPLPLLQHSHKLLAPELKFAGRKQPLPNRTFSSALLSLWLRAKDVVGSVVLVNKVLDTIYSLGQTALNNKHDGQILPIINITWHCHAGSWQ